jgi:hypothetical protein
MDKLEEHIRKYREELDRYDPSSNIWRRIDKQLNNTKYSLKRLITIAAMIVIILGPALFILLHRSVSENNYRPGTKEEVMVNNPQLKETIIYYNNLINSLYREATPLLTGKPEIGKELDNDISQLDSICSEIKNDLKDNVSNQEVVEALIQNYRIKIRLLEDLLLVLKDNNNNPENDKDHEL